MANIDSKTNDEVRRSGPVMMHCVNVNPRQVYCYHWIEYYSGFREHVVLFFFIAVGSLRIKVLWIKTAVYFLNYKFIWSYVYYYCHSKTVTRYTIINSRVSPTVEQRFLNFVKI